MSTGVVLLNFGEPSEPDKERVINYLERIFQRNSELTDADDDRSRMLAERRAPELVDEYEAIGGSPLNAQARRQAAALASELSNRGFDKVTTYVGMQYTEPSVEDAVAQAEREGIDTLVGLPIYPLCGPSTTIEALERLSAVVDEADWHGELVGLSGWHRHPSYLRLRVDNIRSFLTAQGITLDDGTELLYAAHGTPQHYLDAGSRYERYVTEWCDAVANLLGGISYTLGYQNHESRGVEWTTPAIEEVIEEIESDQVVVEPISFMHEQSETLWDLDSELCETATNAGLEFYRIPIPHDNRRFPTVLADLVEPFVTGAAPEMYQLRPCSCTESANVYCLACPR